jgi:hypothetical protein
MNAVGLVLEPIQRVIGQRNMAYLFLLPNLLVFGIFILFPMLLNVYFAMTSGTALYPQDRNFVGSPTSSGSTPAPITPTPTPASRTASGARRATPACSWCSR